MQHKTFTIEEITEILKVHRTYVASLIAEKKLTALKIGRFYRIEASEFEKLIEGQIVSLYTIEDVAKILKIHRLNVASLIKEKTLAAIKINKLYRIREDELQKLIKGKLTNLYTIEQIAEILKIHRTNVAALIQNKKLAALKIGRFYRIREDQLEKLIAGKLVALLTIDDIAESLKVHRNYVVRLIKEKKIKALRIGKFYRVREDDYEDFLKKSEV